MRQQNMKGLAAVILAGGLQTRFKSPDLLKAMAPVGIAGRPHLEILVENLLKSGIRDIVIVAGYMSEVIRENFEPWAKRGVHILLDPADRPDTGGALRNAIEFLIRMTERPAWDVLYWNPDTIARVDLADLYRRHKEEMASGTIVLTNDPTAPNSGAVEVSRTGWITAFREGQGSAFNPGLAHAGIGIIKIKALIEVLYGDKFASRKSFCMFKEVLPQIVEMGASSYLTAGPFVEFGVAERYEQLLRQPWLVDEAYQLAA